MSSGVPIRLTGIWAIPAATTASGIDSVIAVLINPGATALTVMPYFPTSLQSERTKPEVAALEAE